MNLTKNILIFIYMNNLIIILVVTFIAFKLLGKRGQLNKQQFGELMKEGAKLVDVRSTGEYSVSKIKNSVNIPHDKIVNGVKKKRWNSDTVMILFCASGMRSSAALATLKSEGFTKVYNAGTKDRVSNFLS